MCTFQVQLTTRDGQTLELPCQADETILAAASRAHFALPAQCRQGSCGACYAQVRTGRFALGTHSPQALPQEHGGVKEGAVLMCCTQPRSDLAVDLPYTREKIIEGDIPLRSGHITALESVANDTVHLTLQLDDDPTRGVAALFEPGQYMEIGVPGTPHYRAYSLANIDNWEGRLEFLIRLQPGGLFSDYLRNQASVGSPLRLRGPQGAFGIATDSLRPRWLVAGGTGLAPMLSILRRMADFQDRTPVRLIYGVNCSADLVMQDTLKALGHQLPQLQSDVCLMQATANSLAFAGNPVDRLHDLLADVEGTENGCPDIYLCGPPGMIDAASGVARAAGVPEQQIICERFLGS